VDAKPTSHDLIAKSTTTTAVRARARRIAIRLTVACLSMAVLLYAAGWALSRPEPRDRRRITAFLTTAFKRAPG